MKDIRTSLIEAIVKDIRTSLIEAIGTELFNYRQVGDLADSLECQKVAEIAAEVVLERLEMVGYWGKDGELWD